MKFASRVLALALRRFYWESKSIILAWESLEHDTSENEGLSLYRTQIFYLGYCDGAMNSQLEGDKITVD